MHGHACTGLNKLFIRYFLSGTDDLTNNMLEDFMQRLCNQFVNRNSVEIAPTTAENEIATEYIDSGQFYFLHVFYVNY